MDEYQIYCRLCQDEDMSTKFIDGKKLPRQSYIIQKCPDCGNVFCGYHMRHHNCNFYQNGKTKIPCILNQENETTKCICTGKIKECCDIPYCEHHYNEHRKIFHNEPPASLKKNKFTNPVKQKIYEEYGESGLRMSHGIGTIEEYEKEFGTF